MSTNESKWRALFEAWRIGYDAGRIERIGIPSDNTEQAAERAGWKVVRVGPFAEVLARDGDRWMLCLDRGDVIAVDVTNSVTEERTQRPDG